MASLTTSADPRTVQQNRPCLEWLRGLLKQEHADPQTQGHQGCLSQVTAGEEVHPHSFRAEPLQHFHWIFKIIAVAAICVFKDLDISLRNLAIAPEENSPL